ncbi:MAG: type II toxin-antitoxin system HicA family toxin [Defluviitaleaceae bacterium]|nr:type II toxin-antitoxin system HicA family toxin [Defluviitaleaceae bacterium]MCL2274308.1 type II toxin-antitoxin system HicA family toxin [Defluviitaleaceae bacterium]
MASYENAVRKVLQQNGCTFVRRGKGDHDIWHSPIKNKNFPVDGKIKSRHIANTIMKQSGVNYKF